MMMWIASSQPEKNWGVGGQGGKSVKLFLHQKISPAFVMCDGASPMV
jgi:hypothetical protein